MVWTRFGSVTDGALYKSWDAWKNSVYVISDAKGRPLYIGKATGEKNPGFGNRYWGDLQAMGAWGHGARNQLYVGRIKGARRSWYDDLERVLIARESSNTHKRHPKYNQNRRHAQPDDDVRLQHIGDVPRFHHLDQATSHSSRNSEPHGRLGRATHGAE